MAKNMKAQNPTDFMHYSMGQGGSDLVKTTAAQSGFWFAIHCLTAVVFETYTDEGLTGDLTGITLSAGTVICGRITAFKLTSGTVIAYRGQ